MEIKIIKLSKIKPYLNNPRIINEAVDAVANSIKEFGFSVPIVVDKDLVIVAGHTRYEAAYKLGLEEIPCYVAVDMSEEQSQIYRLVDNKVSEMSVWDHEKLTVEMLKLVGDIDMSIFGFEEKMDLPIKDDEFQNVEFSLDEFGEDKFAHTCERCGFRWN